MAYAAAEERSFGERWCQCVCRTARALDRTRAAFTGSLAINGGIALKIPDDSPLSPLRATARGRAASFSRSIAGRALPPL